MRKTAVAAPAVTALAIPSAAVASPGRRATKDGEAGASGEQAPINQRREMISESLFPFHQQAEDEGTYVLAGRAREAEFARPEELSEGPSENTD